ncbi:MAG: hypothetical protein L6R40_001051 [Gallowayella cf. fulva]|nr:MAG: hypothetical protein L6R40_001051 [Xanthomendoza cf. fulva]
MEAPKIDLPITERIHLMATGKIPIPESPFPEFQEVKTTLIASIRPYEAEPRDPEGKRNISKYNKAYRYLLAGSYVRSSELCDEIRDSYLTALDDAKNNNSNKDPHLPAKIPLAHAILFWKASMIKVVLTAMMNTAPAQYRGTFLLLPIAIRDRVLRDVFGGGGGAGAIPEVLRDGDFGLLVV